MSTAVIISMATFALAASFSPGPVNIVALSAGMQFGFRRSVAFVTGATFGFTLLLLSVGFFLRATHNWLPELLIISRWAGVVFLAYMAVSLATDGGKISTSEDRKPPTAIEGGLLQWLNPKAWLASISGIGIFAAGDAPGDLFVFASLYFVICYGSIGSWALAGAVVSEWIRTPLVLAWINRFLASLLTVSAIYLTFFRP
ncbi:MULTISPECIES: LysE family translocator [unclassified Rhizobium]|uniref:LysE family translocator n=1 Tax=unclassified Rhizobium TaxID=2613769 RepID=UPI000AA1C810|nr:MULTISPECIES: LysE family translocator [unclassified Rhizobium]